MLEGGEEEGRREAAMPPKSAITWHAIKNGRKRSFSARGGDAQIIAVRTGRACLSVCARARRAVSIWLGEGPRTTAIIYAARSYKGSQQRHLQLREEEGGRERWTRGDVDSRAQKGRSYSLSPGVLKRFSFSQGGEEDEEALFAAAGTRVVGGGLAFAPFGRSRIFMGPFGGGAWCC